MFNFRNPANRQKKLESEGKRVQPRTYHSKIRNAFAAAALCVATIFGGYGGAGNSQTHADANVNYPDAQQHHDETSDTIRDAEPICQDGPNLTCDGI